MLNWLSRKGGDKRCSPLQITTNYSINGRKRGKPRASGEASVRPRGVRRGHQHEIRNPLTLVYSTLQLLETRHPKITSDKYWQSMRQDVEYMQALLTDLSSLNHSRSLRLSAFSFRAFMEELVLSFAASCADGL